ncbi:Aldolase-type TIM barrel [Penicillium malachiteum]|nr:Aldolase-type TIM barrel [Penicillium malachiteum]
MGNGEFDPTITEKAHLTHAKCLGAQAAHSPTSKTPSEASAQPDHLLLVVGVLLQHVDHLEGRGGALDPGGYHLQEARAFVVVLVQGVEDGLHQVHVRLVALVHRHILGHDQGDAVEHVHLSLRGHDLVVDRHDLRMHAPERRLERTVAEVLVHLRPHESVLIRGLMQHLVCALIHELLRLRELARIPGRAQVDSRDHVPGHVREEGPTLLQILVPLRVRAHLRVDVVDHGRAISPAHHQGRRLVLVLVHAAITLDHSRNLTLRVDHLPNGASSVDHGYALVSLRGHVHALGRSRVYARVGLRDGGHERVHGRVRLLGLTRVHLHARLRVRVHEGVEGRDCARIVVRIRLRSRGHGVKGVQDVVHVHLDVGLHNRGLAYDPEQKFDFVELSGGTYEKLVDVDSKRQSTVAREATKSYVTGGFKTVEGMIGALDTVDGVGLSRSLCQEPILCAHILSGQVKAALFQKLNLQDFGATAGAGGVQIRQIGQNLQPIDLSVQENVDKLSDSLIRWMKAQEENAEACEFPILDQYSLRYDATVVY